MRFCANLSVRFKDVASPALDQAAHVQIADPPRRGEPGTGETNWGSVSGQLDRGGYEG
jgi:hydroxypyruvate isomerase